MGVSQPGSEDVARDRRGEVGTDRGVDEGELDVGRPVQLGVQRAVEPRDRADLDGERAVEVPGEELLGDDRPDVVGHDAGGADLLAVPESDDGVGQCVDRVVDTVALVRGAQPGPVERDGPVRRLDGRGDRGPVPRCRRPAVQQRPRLAAGAPGDAAEHREVTVAESKRHAIASGSPLGQREGRHRAAPSLVWSQLTVSTTSSSTPVRLSIPAWTNGLTSSVSGPLSAAW